ncbi:MAG: hypothetical protein OXN25_01500 [Candidatus Poribacteria bacterium]|nr:hypothetical protein [Candidatus Poribacteria bacterium]
MQLKEFEKRIEKAFKLLEANSDLKPIEIFELISGLLFLRLYSLKRQGQVTVPELPMMVTQFQLVDRAGNIVAHGEIDGDIYRVFDKVFLGGYIEFKDTAELFAAYAGCAIQPEMFQTCADTLQMTLFQPDNK